MLESCYRRSASSPTHPSGSYFSNMDICFADDDGALQSLDVFTRAAIIDFILSGSTIGPSRFSLFVRVCPGWPFAQPEGIVYRFLCSIDACYLFQRSRDSFLANPCYQTCSMLLSIFTNGALLQQNTKTGRYRSMSWVDKNSTGPPDSPIAIKTDPLALNLSEDMLSHCRKQFVCPITHDLMKNPYILCGDGCTYELDAIARWLSIRRTSPLTNQALSTNGLVPNLALRSMSVDYCAT